MDEILKKLGDTRHILREAQIKMKKYSDSLLQDSRYLGGVVDMIEEAIEQKDYDGTNSTNNSKS